MQSCAGSMGSWLLEGVAPAQAWVSPDDAQMGRGLCSPEEAQLLAGSFFPQHPPPRPLGSSAYQAKCVCCALRGPEGLSHGHVRFHSTESPSPLRAPVVQ